MESGTLRDGPSVCFSSVAVDVALLQTAMGNIPSQIQLDQVLQPTNLVLLAISLCVYRVITVRGELAGVGFLPGMRYISGPSIILGKIIPHIPYIYLIPGWPLELKHRVYRQYGCDVISGAFLFDSQSLFLVVADATTAKEIITNKVDFSKPIKMYKTLSLFGPNILASEFDEWKRHRRIVAPSFNEKNNRLVYEETTRIATELFQSWSANGNGRVVKVENAVDFTSDLALMVISAAGFGSRFGWDGADEVPTGHKMTFQKSLRLVLRNLFYRLLFRDGVLRLWGRGRETIDAFNEFRAYMSEMIEDRQRTPEDGSQRSDLFTDLINGASLDTDETENSQLQKDELMGNIFIFLLAGHESTAHSLGFTLALLAVHQDIQEKAFLDLRSMVPQGELPTYAHIVKWAYGLAISYESLRMYSPAMAFPKCAVNDTIITTSSTDGKNTSISIPVPAGTDIIINVSAIHYNPKYWEEPEEFRPERFMGNYNRDAFLPFSGGPRSCIGRRFSEIEALTFLANLILKYKFVATPTDRVETPMETKERLLRWRQGTVTLHPVKVPLTFTVRGD